MRERLATSAAVIALTLLSFFQFPGHTYLGSDTQIYAPMLEHIWDPSTLARDLVATRPHLSYSLYDEIAIALRWLTHSSFHSVLVAQQLVFRALQILGVYLLALSFPLQRKFAMLVAALFTLGATIAGPAVLTFEYEPVPRAFAVALIFFAIGLTAQNHLLAADIVAALAFLYHPPTVAPFWLLYLWLALGRRDFRDLWPLAVGIVLLFVASLVQPGVAEPQVFFTRVSPELEKLQRMRAAYNWVSTWRWGLIWHYVILWTVALTAFWRIQPKAARLFLVGMPAVGIVTIPLSYLLLEKLKWGLIPQFQPARAVLFVTAFAVIVSAAAGIRAAERAGWIESAAWFSIVLAAPAAVPIVSITLPRCLLALGLAIAISGAVYLQRYRWGPAFLAAAAIAPFFLLPTLGGVRNYRVLDTPVLDDVAEFARANTSKDAVFLFADAGTGAAPSIFRALALRAVYVDWKAGGQANYSASVAFEWWQRWQNVNALVFDASQLQKMHALGIDYVVVTARNRPADGKPMYANTEFVLLDLAKTNASP
jgi:uncharacterized protein DUF6798